MHWKTLIEKDYLGAWDLAADDGTPREFTLEIVEVSSQLLRTKEQPKGKRKAVISFKGATKRMVANATNCETIEGMYGGDVAGWIGKRVTLYQTDVRSPKGGTIRGIRVRPMIPKTKAEAIVARPVDAEMRDKQDEAWRPGE